jgi:hypothetical protein
MISIKTLAKKYPLVWHGHHRCKLPIEVLGSSFSYRLSDIKRVKARDESSSDVAWRIKLFKNVKGPIPLAVRLAYNKYIRAHYNYKQLLYYNNYSANRALEINSARPKREIAYREWVSSVKENFSKIMALHAKQCGCKWSLAQLNIFSYMPKS